MRRSSVLLLEEVTVTARKRQEGAQQVPLSITALSGDQLEALKVRDLTDLSVGMPNVSLDDIGTARGTANFSIRGLGINSSIPSIDPTVGVFVDGVYLGLNSGVIFDMFDLTSIEVLRGPQGILFGRNVTGGAILLNTRKPPKRFEARLRTAVDGGGDGGYNRYLMGSAGGPLGEQVAAKITAYYNNDEGWFENEFDGDDFGAIEQTRVRPVLTWNPDAGTELILRYEYSESEGDGPAAQTHTNGFGVSGAFDNFARDSHEFSVDERGFQDMETHFVTAELNLDVDFGEGTITNIFGWRNYENRFYSDIDAQSVWLFHVAAWLESRQWSNELRYNGLFAGRAHLTTGVYYFTNDIDYHERRELLGIATGGAAPAAQFDGGGEYEVETFGVFAALDYELTERATLVAGLRYTNENKDARIASLSRNINAPCNIVTMGNCEFDFVEGEKWASWSPKLGVTWQLAEKAHLYAHWTRGFRSGGYNLRNTSFNPADTPGPFDEERVDSFEIGYKSTWARGRLNAAIFYNMIDDMQRELNLPSQGAGVVQLVRNTADVTIAGVEVEGAFSLTESLLLSASVGYTDAEYDSVREDLNGDGAIDSGDENLELPRAPEWTYSLGLSHDLVIGSRGLLTARIQYAYRDESAYTDNNLGFVLEQEMLDAGLDFHSRDGRWVVSVYGRNLLDTVKHGGDTQLPNLIGSVPTGGTFSPLAKGRVYGLEVTCNLF